MNLSVDSKGPDKTAQICSQVPFFDRIWHVGTFLYGTVLVICSKTLKYELKSAMVNEPSVFELLRCVTVTTLLCFRHLSESPFVA